ncbi:MAG: RNA polymerase sigma factor [Oscillospiraceae bacterium]|nr:RNA polymerase sigma factor [Oscillospiraceae bacterium]
MLQTDTADAVSRYGPMVYRLACAMLRSRHDADDVFQEVFLRYHRAAPAFASEEHRKAWLLKVTANCAKSLRASPWRQRAVPLEDVYACTDPAESAVDSAMAQLPGKYRAVVHLYYYEGYRTEEIAQILGRSPSTVRAQLTRARQKLKELLKEEF